MSLLSKRKINDNINIDNGYIYLITEDKISDNKDFYIKVGKTSGFRDPKKRLREHQTGNPRILKLVKEFYVENHVSQIENNILTFLQKQRVHDEWFFVSKTIMNNIIERLQNIQNSILIKDYKLLPSINNNVKTASESEEAIIQQYLQTVEKKNTANALTNEAKFRLRKELENEYCKIENVLELQKVSDIYRLNNEKKQ